MKADEPDQYSGSRCILTGVPLTRANNSRAHVIPSALGGRLKPWGILSREANTRLGDTIDLLLIEALSPFMTHLSASRDRGENQPITMEDASGTKYRVAFDEPIALQRPLYEETDEGDATRIRIEARTLREARTLLGRVEAKHKDFNVDEAMKHAVVAQEWPEGALKSSFEIGPRRTFPGAFVAGTIFAVAKGLQPHPQFRSFVDDFDLEEPIAPPDTFYLYLPEGAVTAAGEVTHIIVLVSDPNRQQTLVWINLFGILEVAVLQPYAASETRFESYGVDVLTGQEVTVQIDPSILLERQWVGSHELGADLWSMIEARVGHIIGIAQRRASDALIERHLHEVLENTPQPISGEGLLHALRPVVEFTMLEIRRPGETNGVAQEKLAMFEN